VNKGGRKVFNEEESNLLISILKEKILFSEELANLTNGNAKIIATDYEHTLKNILNKLIKVNR